MDDQTTVYGKLPAAVVAAANEAGIYADDGYVNYASGTADIVINHGLVVAEGGLRISVGVSRLRPDFDGMSEVVRSDTITEEEAIGLIARWGQLLKHETALEHEATVAAESQFRI